MVPIGPSAASVVGNASVSAAAIPGVSMQPAQIAPASDILVATSVRKVYRTGAVEVEALRSVDLRVSAGEFVAVMGPSGSGKTTLLNCLSGLDDIDSGSVEVEGSDIHAMRDA